MEGKTLQPEDLSRLGRAKVDTATSPDDAPEILEQIRSQEIETVIVGGCDINGVFRAKRVRSEHFIASAEPAVEFGEDWGATDINDFFQPRPARFEGWWPDWSTGFANIEAVADLSTLRRVPWLERTAVALCNYRFPDGRAYEIAPRNVLCRVLERYERHELQPRLAAEFEFVVFRETEQSALEKGFRDLRTLTARPMVYGALQATVDDHLIGRIVEALGAMRVPVQAWYPEGGKAQYELNLAHVRALEAADCGFLFKQGVKELCALEGLTATFMPKLPASEYGSSLHVHQSLWHDETSAFYDANRPDGMSRLMRHFVGGQLETLIPFAPIWLPTPPAYKRLVPHSAAGTTKTWGGDNKTLSLRMLASEPDRCRVEHRVPGADSNIYLAFAAMLAGGLYGIENEIELPPPTTGDAYSNCNLETLPRSLDAAISSFEQSPVANEYLGEIFVRHYAATRRWEVEQSMQEVTDWELKRYFTRG